MERTGRTVDDASHDGREGSLSRGSGKETASGRQAIAGPGPGKGASEEPIGSADRGGRRRETEWRAGDRRRGERAGADTTASAWQITPAEPASSLSRSGVGIEDEPSPAAKPSTDGEATIRKSQGEARLAESGVRPWIAMASKTIRYPAQIDRLATPAITV